MDRRIQKTKHAIQNACFSLITSNKPAKVTISEIARKANIDRKTFYLHYNSINEVIRDCCDEQIKELLLLLERQEFFDHPFDINGIFQAVNILVTKDIDLFKSLASTYEYNYLWDEIKKILANTFTKVYSDKLNLSKVEMNCYSQFFSSATIDIYVSWLKNEIPMTLNELGEFSAKASYYGLQLPFNECSQ